MHTLGSLRHQAGSVNSVLIIDVADLKVWQYYCTCSLARRVSNCFCKSMTLLGDAPLSLLGVGVCLLLLELPFG